MSGTPSLKLGLKALAGAEIGGVRGILNGTTNYILTEMVRGLGYDAALKEAQHLDYAEADPEADVEGCDALTKTVILANVPLGGDVKVDEVERGRASPESALPTSKQPKKKASAGNLSLGLGGRVAGLRPEAQLEGLRPR